MFSKATKYSELDDELDIKEEINGYLKKNNNICVNIQNSNLVLIRDLLIYGKIPKKQKKETLYYLGVYHKNKNNTAKSIKYFAKASQKGIPEAMHILGYLYSKNGNDAMMIKCYKMAIKKGYSPSMNSLGLYYKHRKQYKNMQMYYKMAISRGNKNAMSNYAFYWRECQNYNKMREYYKMAIDKGSAEAMSNYGCHFFARGDNETALRYLVMANKHGLNRLTNINTVLATINKRSYFIRYERLLNEINVKRLAILRNAI